MSGLHTVRHRTFFVCRPLSRHRACPLGRGHGDERRWKRGGRGNRGAAQPHGDADGSVPGQAAHGPQVGAGWVGRRTLALLETKGLSVLLLSLLLLFLTLLDSELVSKHPRGAAVTQQGELDAVVGNKTQAQKQGKCAFLGFALLYSRVFRTIGFRNCHQHTPPSSSPRRI